MRGTSLLRLPLLSLVLASCAGTPRASQKPVEPPPSTVSAKPSKPVAAAPERTRTTGETPAPLEGKRISEVQIRYLGAATVDEARLRNLINTMVGGRYSSERIDTDIKNLYESGNIDDVRVLAEPEVDGVRVIYEVTTRGLIWHSGFVGNTAFSDERLAKESGLRVGAKPTPNSLAGAREKLEAYYRTHGYSQAKVELAWNRTYFTFQIEEGPKTSS